MSDSLISTAALAERIGDPSMVVLDGSWYLPADGRNPWTEYLAGHIPGARFFDVEASSRPDTDLPHMAPTPEVLAGYAQTLGIGPSNDVVVYDGSGANLSAARVWWLFRAIGFDRVAVLDGGFSAWRAEGRPVERGQRVVEPAAEAIVPRPEPGRWRVLADIVALQGTDAEHTVVDARSAARFRGEEAEPRAGVRGGHIPGSRNVPYRSLVNGAGRLRPAAELSELFAEAGVALDRPVVATCGSGLSACALLLALDRLGHRDGALYDGSWAEYGGQETTPVATGPSGTG